MDSILESTREFLNNDKELNESSLAGGIIVWGADQEVLEQQALSELNIFAKENGRIDTCIQNDLEEGEIIEGPEIRKTLDVALNFDNYIKSQADLQKRQDFKRSLAKHDHTIKLTNKISNESKRKVKKRKVVQNEVDESSTIEFTPEINESTFTNSQSIAATNEPTDVNADAEEDVDVEEDSGSEYAPSEGEVDDSDYEGDSKVDITDISTKQKRKRVSKTDQVQKIRDDGLWEYYKSRLKAYYKKLEENVSLKEMNIDDDNDEEEEKIEYQILKAGLKVPIDIWNKLYGYQQEGVKWLWKLHRKETGGILGDEMGLGKTVQIIVFLRSLEVSRVMSCHGRFNGLGPSLIVCPATVIHQWVQHFHEWAPEFRIGILHQSGSFQGNKADLIKEMHKSKGIIITTYLGILKYKGNLLDYNWHYLILDEGHKIRNPTAKVTIAIKHIRTPHRIMLTGSPMQNNLTELWSLFDFTNPGMLGNLTTFQEHFATPILHGGFANSTSMQEATALSVASTLKEIIMPYLLRRSKADVQHHICLPNKNEQVLFCSLTKEQKDIYKEYLMSEQVNMILGRGVKNWFSQNFIRANVLVAITALRKICNHPDIYLHDSSNGDKNSLVDKDDGFGYYKKSGKMIVVSALLKIWKKQGHRVLLFSQGRWMITIFQMFLEQQGYKYLKMDGSTSINSRQPLIDKFNNDLSYDVFLLTTRVGGLGINLTGANRVIIYDPDWNPATDTQARERAWRIGQNKEVTVYRLLSAGTIEEKIYQRQVWKQLLSNKVLLDPRTSRFFKSSDLYDLFSLQENDSNPETANIFHDSRVRIQENLNKSKKEKKRKSKTTPETSEESTDITFSDDKIQAMKNLAQQISKSLSRKEVKKTSLQKDLEEERQIKLKHKAELKQLTPEALFLYNKERASTQEDVSVNKIDDLEAKVGFSEALEYAEKTAKLHHVLNMKKGEIHEKVIKTAKKIHKTVTKENSEYPIDKYKQPSCSNSKTEPKVKKREKQSHKTKIDNSGTIDGEHVNGLVKTEMRKYKEHKNKFDSNQDDFVLGKLFQKKGVSGALQHDSIVQSRPQENSLRIHTEARFRAEKSLEALRKSRLDNWRW